MQVPLLAPAQEGMRMTVDDKKISLFVVAITVVLAAVISPFVFGMFGGISKTSIAETTISTPAPTPAINEAFGPARLCNYSCTDDPDCHAGCPPQEIPILSKDLIRTVTNESVTDRFPLPGNGTYRILVKTYQPETEVTVAVEYQELISIDKFGTKTYGGFETPGGQCIDYSRAYSGATCFPSRIPGAVSIYSIGNVDRWDDLNRVFNFPSRALLGGPREYEDEFPVIVPTDIINPRLDIITTRAHQGRITVELWRVA